jgi:hypothetical protein
MTLIHIYWHGGKHRRIVCHHFRTSTQWLAAASLQEPKKKYRHYKLIGAGNPSTTPLSPSQFEARRQAQLRQLRERK